MLGEFYSIIGIDKDLRNLIEIGYIHKFVLRDSSSNIDTNERHTMYYDIQEAINKSNELVNAIDIAAEIFASGGYLSEKEIYVQEINVYNDERTKKEIEYRNFIDSYHDI